MSALDRFLEISYVTQTAVPAWNQLWRDAKAELAALRAEVEDWRNAAQSALAPCGDEVHCVCVGPLRSRVAALEKACEAADCINGQMIAMDGCRYIAVTPELIDEYHAAREASR